jgi:hypothetical protein
MPGNSPGTVLPQSLFFTLASNVSVQKATPQLVNLDRGWVSDTLFAKLCTKSFSSV